MRPAAALFFVIFICVECKPNLKLGNVEAGKELDNIPVGKQVIGSDNVEVKQDGTINVENVKSSETQSGSNDSQYNSYSAGDSSGSETHEMGRRNEARNKHKETTHNGLQVNPDGVKIYDKKETEDDNKTQQSEYRRDAYQSNKNGPNSSSHSESEYESQRNRSTHDKKRQTEENEYNLGLDGTKVKKSRESMEEHEEKSNESGWFQNQEEVYKQQNGQDTYTRSGSGGAYQTSNAKKTTKVNKTTQEHTQDQHKSGQMKNGLRFPDEFYSYLNRDSRKLGLSGQYRHNRGNVTKLHYGDVRKDYLLTVARKLYSKSRDAANYNTSDILQSIKSYRKSPVPSHYSNIKFVEDKFSKVPIHYYTGIKYGVIDPDVKKAIFSHDLRNLRKIQHKPRNVNNIFKSIGYNRYHEIDTTAHKNNLDEIIIKSNTSAVSDFNKNKEMIRRGEESTGTNKHSRYNNTRVTLNAEDNNKVSSVGTRDFLNAGTKPVITSIKSHDDHNFADNISKMYSGSYDSSENDRITDNIFSNHIKNSKMESTVSDEFYDTKISENYTLPASYIQAMPDMSESKNVNTPKIDKADSTNAAIMIADSYDGKLDTNNENMSNITELNIYSNEDKTSDVNSTDTPNLFDGSTDYFDTLSSIVTANPFTENYDDSTNTAFAIDNVDSQSFDSDTLVTTTSLYPIPNSTDGFLSETIAIELPHASDNFIPDINISDGSLQESYIWSSTLKPYFDSNNVDGTAINNFDSNINTSIATTIIYSDTNSSDENFISGNRTIDIENKFDILSDTSFSTDDLASDSTAMSINNQFNNSTDAADINGFNSNFMDSDSQMDTSTTYLLTSSVNNFEKSDMLTTDDVNSNFNDSDSSIVTAMTPLVTNITDKLSSDDTAIDINKTFSYSNEAIDVNGSDSTFNGSYGLKNSGTRYSIDNSVDAFASDDIAIEVPGEFSDSSATIATNDIINNFNEAAAFNMATSPYLDTNSENRPSPDDWMFTESAFSNLRDTGVSLTTTDMTLLVFNSTDASIPANTLINLATELKNVSKSTINDDSGSNFANISDIPTATIYPMNNGADDFATVNMAIDIANENSNLSDSTAINISENNFNDTEIMFSTETTFPVANSSKSFADSIATDIVNEYNSSDSAAISSSDSNFKDSTLIKTTYSTPNSSDNFISNNLTTDMTINSSDTINTINDSSYNNTNNFDISNTSEMDSSTISNAGDYALVNITKDEDNVNDNSAISDGVVSNFNVSDESITTETTFLIANSSDDYNSNNMVAGIANVHDNTSETTLPDLFYSYFDSTPKDKITADTEKSNLISGSWIDSNISITERNEIRSSHYSSNTIADTDNNLSTFINISNAGEVSTISSTTVINTDVLSDTKDTPNSVQGTHSNSNPALSSPSASITSDSGGTSDIGKTGSSIISNDAITAITNNVPTSGVAKKLNGDNTPGRNGAAGNKDNTGKPVSVKPRNDKFVFTEETESKSDEDASIIRSSSSEQPIFTSVDSSRLDSGSMSIETS